MVDHRTLALTPQQHLRRLLEPGAGHSAHPNSAGASTVHGYFPQLDTALQARAQVIQIDVPGIGAASDRRLLRLPEYASSLAQAIRAQAGGPLVVVGHSLGGLVALRLAIDEPGLAAGLLLLDPTPPTPSGEEMTGQRGSRQRLLAGSAAARVFSCDHTNSTISAGAFDGERAASGRFKTAARGAAGGRPWVALVSSGEPQQPNQKPTTADTQPRQATISSARLPYGGAGPSA
jgi:pimeloyl-ACP methyl ester carboxylesterase